MKLIAVLFELCIKVVFGHDAEFLQRRHAGISHNIRFKVQNAFDIAQRHVQHQTQTAWQRLQKPDMGARRGQIDVPHALATHFGLGDFNATLLADHTTVLQTLVLTAQAFVIFDRSENFGAKQTIALRLERAVVNGFWFFNFTKRPRTDLLGRGHADFDGIEMLIGRELFKQVE